MKKFLNPFYALCVFTTAYVALVLPYTISFFNNIAEPPAGALSYVSSFAVPIFLIGLELAAVKLACETWETKNKKMLFILFMFLICQSLPIFSIYYDTTKKEYYSEAKAKEDKRVEVISNEKRRIESRNILISNKKGQNFNDRQEIIAKLHDRILDVSNREREVEKSIAEMNRGIPQFFIVNEDDLAINAKKTELREMRSIRKSLLAKLGALSIEKKELEADRRKVESELKFEQETLKREIEKIEMELKNEEVELASLIGSTNHISELEYIKNSFSTAKGKLALYISLLLPLTILSVTFALRKNVKSKVQLFELQEHLEYIAALPTESQLTFSKMILPNIITNVEIFKATKAIANGSLNLHLGYDSIRQLLDQIKIVREQIEISSIEKSIKNYLLDEIEQRTNKLILEV